MDNEKWEGRGQQAAGKGKEIAGKVTGDEERENEGRSDQMEGKGKETFGKAKEKVDEMVDKFRK
jgi:uncharacterized protein YjbJ (UPF0337 family)